MLPRILITFDHIPIVGKVELQDKYNKFYWNDDIIDTYTDILNKYIFDKKFIKKEDFNKLSGKSTEKFILSSCMKASNPMESLPYYLKNSVDKVIKVSNAFCKMYEMCFLDDIDQVIKNHSIEEKKLNIMFLAEAPGQFVLAMIYYIGNHYPNMLDENLLEYNCTTLPIDEELALKDIYSIIANNLDKWFFMDHTRSEDTIEMIKKFGRASFDIVTGDIGLPAEAGIELENFIYLEELGQFISACALLKNKGVAVLKMFNIKFYGTACILRLAIGLFEKVKIFKPFTSRQSNNECYFILTNFKKELFDPLYDPLINILDEEKKFKIKWIDENKGLYIKYKSFLSTDNFSDLMVENLRTIHRCQYLRSVPYWRNAFITYLNIENTDQSIKSIMTKIFRESNKNIKKYPLMWKDMFPLHSLGEKFYIFTNFKPNDIKNTSLKSNKSSRKKY